MTLDLQPVELNGKIVTPEDVLYPEEKPGSVTGES